MRETVRYAFILGVICLVSSTVLAFVNALTEPKIELQQQEEKQAALREVMPQGEDFKPDKTEGKPDYYNVYDSNKKLIGFVISASTKGYSSIIEIMVGLDLNFDINAVKIISQSETPGLGTKITEPSFQNQFKGKNQTSISKVQAITGATISSSAVIRAVKERIAEMKEQLVKEKQNAG